MKYNNLIKCIMNNYERLEGMVAATFTPMDENGDVNLSVIDKYADWIASVFQRVAGVTEK